MNSIPDTPTLKLIARWHPYWLKTEAAWKRLYRVLFEIKKDSITTLTGGMETKAYCRHLSEWSRRMRKLERKLGGQLGCCQIDDLMEKYSRQGREAVQ